MFLFSGRFPANLDFFFGFSGILHDCIDIFHLFRNTPDCLKAYNLSGLSEGFLVNMKDYRFRKFWSREMKIGFSRP